MDPLFFEKDADQANQFNQARTEEAKKFNQERSERQQEEVYDNMYNLTKKADIEFDPDYIDG